MIKLVLEKLESMLNKKLYIRKHQKHFLSLKKWTLETFFFG